jgi:hypothetical protein
VAPDPRPAGDGPSRFTHAYDYRSGVSVTATIGVWMHRAPVFERGAVADWLGIPYLGKELLEPINVLWVDPLARSEDEARDNVVAFLDRCGFDREGNVFFGEIPRHSSGYYASYGTGIWREQYDPDDAWVERRFLRGIVDSNHGRIFPSHAVLSARGQSVYFTSGAFSREGPLGTLGSGAECLFARERCHPFRSFNEARDALNCGARGWSVHAPRADFANRYPPSLGLSFSTADHDGVLVLARSG